MDTERDPTETLWRRHEFLQALSDGPRTKEQLKQELGYAEQTIYKRIRELKQQSLAKQNQDSYTLTLYGHLTLQKFHELENTKETRELLNHPHINEHIPFEIIKDAEFVKRDGNTPRKPLMYYDDKFRQSTHVDAVTCTLLSPSRIDKYQQYMKEEDRKIRGVFQSKTAEYILSEHEGVIPTNIESGNLEAWVTHEEIPYSFVILDNSEVLVLVYDSEHTTKGTVSIKGIIHNDSTAAVNWAKHEFEEAKRGASKLHSGDITPQQ